MLLPTPNPAVSRWNVWDYVKKTASSLPAVNGSCLAALPPVPDGELWFVDRLRVMCNSTSNTIAYVYANGSLADDFVEDGTLTGNFDVADNASPLLLLTGEPLTIQWTGASAGAVARLRAQITVMRLANGYT
ncbi:MAG: hypothetical protein HOV96_19595 [Nonomuraea sp.]|nr:hypothetical protein [Nonomuraea sp.]